MNSITPDVSAATEIDAIRRKHWRENQGGEIAWCHWCDADWPCHTAAVLQAYDEAIAARERAEAEVQGLWARLDHYRSVHRCGHQAKCWPDDAAESALDTQAAAQQREGLDGL